MRARNDKAGMQRMVAAATSQLGQGLLPPDTAASIVRALVAAPGDDADDDGAPVAVSDPQEADAEDLAPTAAAPARGLADAARACAENPVGVAKASAGGGGATQAPPADSNAQTDLADQVVSRLADGSVESRVEAAGVVVRFPFLAPDFDVEAALQAGLKAGLPDAVLYLGELYLDGARATRDPRKALAFLRRAAGEPATALAAQYYLGRLYQFGYLDEVEPRQAVDHLLYAARRGYVSADGALARFYASGKGVCPNHVYAYVFAQLGARDGAGSIRTLAGQLNGVLTAQQRQAAQNLLRDEQAARRTLPSAQPGLAEAGSPTP
jgi:TPR repeat protein